MKVTFIIFYKDFHSKMKKAVRTTFDPFDPKFVALARQCFILDVLDAFNVTNYVFENYMMTPTLTQIVNLDKYIKLAKIHTDRAEDVLEKYILESKASIDVVDGVLPVVDSNLSIPGPEPIKQLSYVYDESHLKTNPMFVKFEGRIELNLDCERFYDERSYPIVTLLKNLFSLTSSEVSVSSLNTYALKIDKALALLVPEDGQQLDYSVDSLSEAIEFKCTEPFFTSIERVIFGFLSKKSEVDSVLIRLGKLTF